MFGIFNQTLFYSTKVNFLSSQIKAIIDALVIIIIYLHFFVSKNVLLILKGWVILNLFSFMGQIIQYVDSTEEVGIQHWNCYFETY